MERNHGIDFLKNICVVMIVTLHILKASGTLVTNNDAARYCLSWLLETLSYCAVDCFALMTGYLMLGKKFKLSRIISLWMQVFFYSTGILALFAIFSPNLLTKHDIIAALFPIASSSYWYLTAYMFLLFLMPFLNLLLDNLDRSATNLLVTAVVVLLSVLLTILNYDIFFTNKGYSMLWLAGLYIIGARIRKYGFNKNISAIDAFFAYLVVSVAVWISIPYYGIQWLNYTSPMILLASVSLLFCSLRINWRHQAFCKIMSLLAPLSFSTYLIHAHPLLWKTILSPWFSAYAFLPSGGFIPAVIVSAVIMQIVCCLIEFLRSKIFSLLRIHVFENYIDCRIDYFWHSAL